jgi:hypothetical protein
MVPSEAGVGAGLAGVVVDGTAVGAGVVCCARATLPPNRLPALRNASWAVVARKVVAVRCRRVVAERLGSLCETMHQV